MGQPFPTAATQTKGAFQVRDPRFNPCTKVMQFAINPLALGHLLDFQTFFLMEGHILDPLHFGKPNRTTRGIDRGCSLGLIDRINIGQTRPGSLNQILAQHGFLILTPRIVDGAHSLLRPPLMISIGQ